ncbi:sugar phosphate isomerase/epimerase family protein [Propionibacteriaceae bacterium Y2011]|uniref:sugar phosphate isomerase/epimerase family protein n=1 Tax=Microlunatus sp. Y2014 TaxID=3418488 RepID=UPI003B491BA7
MSVSPMPKIVLSTSCVYPESTASGFEIAHRLGYDAVEVMVGIDPVAADIDAVKKLRDYHQVEVASIHAPCLLVTQRVWGNDPWEKLERSAVAARTLGADTVVVHPPFRWQRDYATSFVEGIRRLNASTGITFAVENMYPWRTGRAELKAYMPGWDPAEFDYDHLTLDLSHASTAKQQSLDLVGQWGDRLHHLHLTDGRGSLKDEHLLPGDGDQQADKVLAKLTERGFSGHVVLEANTRRSASRHEREEKLARALAFIKTHLGATAPTPAA